AAANRRARARTVSPAAVAHWPARVAAAPEGAVSVDGGSVCNSYRYAAESTSASVAWWTDGRGRKTVRVNAGRGYAASTAYGRSRGERERESGWAAVFPERAGRLATRRRERLQRLIERLGPEGQDDRLAILARDRHLAAAAGNGLLVADHPTRPKVVQVVVRDTTTGQRHHITVPPKFATPSSKTYQSLGSSAARVHAAVAWTFALKPGRYAPAVEA